MVHVPFCRTMPRTHPGNTFSSMARCDLARTSSSSMIIFCEEHLFKRAALLYLLRCLFHRYLAMRHDIYAPRNREHRLDTVFNDENGDVSHLVDFFYERKNLFHYFRRETERRLI